jgi:hypothetical protein
MEQILILHLGIVMLEMYRNSKSSLIIFKLDYSHTNQLVEKSDKVCNALPNAS